MPWTRHDCADARRLAEHIPDWLREEPAACALLSFVADLPTSWCTVFSNTRGPGLAIAQSPERPPIIAVADPGDPEAPAPELVDLVHAELRRPDRDIPGLNGPPPWIEALCARLDLPIRHRMGLRLHRLHGEAQLPRAVPGRLQAAGAADLPVLREWMQAFEREAVPDEPRRDLDDETLRRVLPDAWLWWADGQARSMLRRGRPCHGGWTISGVYTPPEERCRGWAGAAVHGLTQQLLEEGARYVALYTDLANPTSNALYARVGFRPLCDQVQVLWERPEKANDPPA